jgi:hypothetical protein
MPKTSTYKLWELIQHQQSLKPEEQFEIMIEDCIYEPQGMGSGTELIDFSVGCSGAIGWINLKGFYRPERTAKVARFAEIIEELKPQKE